MEKILVELSSQELLSISHALTMSGFYELQHKIALILREAREKAKNK